MKFEFVEFYPINPLRRTEKQVRRGVVGSLHIFLCDVNMDIRGINVEYHNEKVMHKRIKYTLPHIPNWDEDKQQRVSFPTINFIVSKDRQALFTFLYGEVNKIVFKRLIELYGGKNKLPIKFDKNLGFKGKKID